MIMHPLKLQTKRLTLTIPEVSDAKAMLAFHQENKKHLLKWEPVRPKLFYTIQFWHQQIRTTQKLLKSGEGFRLNIHLKSEDTLIGMINFGNIERGPFQCCRLGYKIGKAYEGKGYMTEALKAAVDYMFKEQNFQFLL